MLNVPRLRILLELHRRGSLAQVAEALSCSPSAVSQQLSLLERETGVQLLEHVGRGVRLTEEAQILVDHAEAVIRRLEEAEADLAAAQPELRGRLRIASFQTVVSELAPAFLTTLAEQHPGLAVDVSLRQVDHAYSGLLSHEFDVILGEEFPGIPETVRKHVDRSDLVRDPLLLAVPAAGRFSGVPRRLAELADAPWALDPAGTTAGMWARSICRSAGFEPIVTFEGPDPLMHAHLVRTGHAVAFVPAIIVARHLSEVTVVGLPGDPARVLYTAVREGRARHPAVQAFRTAIAATVAERSEPVPSTRLTR